MVLPVVFAAINRSLLTGISFAMCFIAMTTGMMRKTPNYTNNGAYGQSASEIGATFSIKA